MAEVVKTYYKNGQLETEVFVINGKHNGELIKNMFLQRWYRNWINDGIKIENKNIWIYILFIIKLTNK